MVSKVTVVVLWRAAVEWMQALKVAMSEDCVSTRRHFESTEMPDEADAPAVINPPQSRFIANVSLPQKFDTKENLAANW